MSDHTREKATLFQRRGIDGLLTADDLRALDAVAAGALCDECRWQFATVVARHRKLCVTCNECERAFRGVEAVALRQQRHGARRT